MKVLSTFWVGNIFTTKRVALRPPFGIEHYFEMSKVDATTALALYRHFCRQTERVVEYLTIARKLQNLLNVPIPSLKHVSEAVLVLGAHV